MYSDKNMVICPICGKTDYTDALSAWNRKYCSDDCRRTAKRRTYHLKKSKRKITMKKLTEKAMEAFDNGMSYGQWVSHQHLEGKVRDIVKCKVKQLKGAKNE